MILSESPFVRLSCILCNWSDTLVTCPFSFTVKTVLKDYKRRSPGALKLRCFTLSCRQSDVARWGLFKEEVPWDTELESGQGDFHVIHNIYLSLRFKPPMSGSLYKQRCFRQVFSVLTHSYINHVKRWSSSQYRGLFFSCLLHSRKKRGEEVN